MNQVPLQQKRELAELLSIVRVAHHIPGRIRLKINGRLPGWLERDTAEMHERLRALPSVTHIKINPVAGSATITYRNSEAIYRCFENLRQGNCEPLLEYLHQEAVLS
ncbi:HMA2 domain-containing protein [Desulfurispira natronophila]|uniref:Cation transporter n=1 Tax=Desulfurispira natronophila TaxID=682562 RepID=A0A7W7Y3P5_9BACT|nr:hypothetical protein [Desulfurispira natronophila]MBB5021516.1 hypothetical protein [Desulfurispira natronophila]